MDHKPNLSNTTGKASCRGGLCDALALPASLSPRPAPRDTHLPQWAEALPRTAFLLFDAGDGDWFPYPKKRAEVHTEEAWVEMVLEAVRGAIGRADALLDERLGALGLTNDALVLGGFSQGAAMSAYTGLRRGCLGVLPCCLIDNFSSFYIVGLAVCSFTFYCVILKLDPSSNMYFFSSSNHLFPLAPQSYRVECPSR